MKTLWLAAAALLVPATGAGAETLYSQDFSAGQAGITGGTAATTLSGERYLQLANAADDATLTVATAGYTGLTLGFDLYAVQSLDGNGPDGGGPDNFLLYLNGSATPAYVFNVANYDAGSNTQSFNGDLALSGPGNTYAPLTGAVARGTLGYGTGPFGDSTYRVSLALADAAVTSIRLSGATNEGRTDPTGTSTGGNEAYGIDNLSLTGTAVTADPGAVPEPASWALMIGGLGLVGGAARRGRRAALA